MFTYGMGSTDIQYLSSNRAFGYHTVSITYYYYTFVGLLKYNYFSPIVQQSTNIKGINTIVSVDTLIVLTFNVSLEGNKKLFEGSNLGY